MAEAANNIVPLTGSPLSRGSRENISANITAFNSFINEQKNLNAQKTRADDYQNVLIQGGQTSVTSLQNQLEGISRELSSLSQNVNTISQTVQQQSSAEQLRLNAERENQKRLSERRIAIGKEGELEQRIENSLSSPVLAVQNKVGSLFSRVESAFTTLFLGWLGNSVINYLKAQAEGDVQKLGEIKRKIVGGLVIGVGALVAVKTGLGMVGKAISAVTSGVASLLSKLVTAPFRLLGSGIRALSPGGAKPPGKPGGQPGGGPGVGKFVTFLSSLMNFRNGEMADGILSAMALAAKAPGAIGAIGKIAGMAFTVDEIAEALGSNIFGNDKRNKLVQEIAEGATKDKAKPAPTSVASPPPAAKQSSPPPAEVTPQTPMASLPDLVDSGSGAVNDTPEGAEPQAQVSPSTSMTPQSSDLMVNPGSTTTQPGASETGRIDTDSSQPTISQEQRSSEPALTNESDKTKPTTTPAAQITAPPKDTNKVTALPEVQPNVVIASDTTSGAMVDQGSQSSSQSRPAPNPDTPSISSSNPDNFYVLYSQLNYNIVM